MEGTLESFFLRILIPAQAQAAAGDAVSATAKAHSATATARRLEALRVEVAASSRKASPGNPFLGLGPPVVPFYPFLEEVSPTKIGKMGTLILTSLLEDLVGQPTSGN